MRIVLAVALLLITSPALAFDDGIDVECGIARPHDLDMPPGSSGSSYTPNYWTAYYIRSALTPQPKWVQFVERPLFPGAAAMKLVQRYKTKGLQQTNVFAVVATFGISTGGLQQANAPRPLAGPWLLTVTDSLGKTCSYPFTVPPPNDGCTADTVNNDNSLCVSE